MFQPTYPIRTPRLTLRPVTLDDLDDVYAWQCRPDVVRWMYGATPRTREQSRASVLAMAGEDEAGLDCLDARVPCCGAVVSLATLRFDWPVGFARFEVTAMNATRAKYELDAEELAHAADLLGHLVTQILAHY